MGTNALCDVGSHHLVMALNCVYPLTGSICSSARPLVAICTQISYSGIIINSHYYHYYYYFVQNCAMINFAYSEVKSFPQYFKADTLLFEI